MRVSFAIALLLCAAGCRQKMTERLSVEGTVTLQGDLITSGTIAFLPSGDIQGPSAGTEITDGQYHIPARSGPVAGPYMARINIVPWATETRTQREAVKARTVEVPVAINAKETECHFELPLARQRATTIGTPTPW